MCTSCMGGSPGVLHACMWSVARAPQLARVFAHVEHGWTILNGDLALLAGLRHDCHQWPSDTTECITKRNAIAAEAQTATAQVHADGEHVAILEWAWRW